MPERLPDAQIVSSAPDGGARFDVFLSHNSRDKPAVERIARKLKRAGLEPWLDTWCLTPGGRWQDELAAGLRASSACAVFIGPSDLGDWELQELDLAVDRAAKDRGFRLVPVLLPGLPEPFDATNLPPFLSTRTWVDFRRGYDDSRAFQSLINAVKGIPFGPAVELARDGDVAPYRGLRTFDEEHAEFFFGRESDVQRLLEKLKATRFLAVLGPSGSGKSSLVRAGLIPSLRRGALPGSESWLISVLTPGAHPLTALAAQLIRLTSDGAMQRTLDDLGSDQRTLHLGIELALAGRPSGDRVVCVIDQLEELFTLARDEVERAQFLANVLYAATVPDGRSVVTLTLRADFYPRCAAYPELSQLIAGQQFLVSPMDDEGLRQAIEEPARRVALDFEEGLVPTILDDVHNQPGALPLLEHALLELWERRRGRMLTLEAYRDSGGVQGAIASRADDIYAAFTPAEKEVARRAFLRLTQPGEGTDDTRRRAAISELATSTGESEAIENVLRALVDARMLTTSGDEGTSERWVDVSHEALIRGWPRLRRWLDEDRAGLRIHRRLTEAAQEWQRLRRDEGVLYRGARLAETIEWEERDETALNELERDFLAASAGLQARERRAAQRRVRLTVAGLVVALVLIGAGALLALRASRIAAEERDLAFSRELAAHAMAQVPVDPELSILLATEAARIAPTDQARDALRQSMRASHLRTVLRGHKGSVRSAAFSPDGRLAVTAGDDATARIWDLRAKKSIAVLRGHSGAVRDAAFGLEGKLVVTAGEDGIARVWDAMGEPIAELRGHPSPVSSADFSADGKLVVTASTDGARIWDVATGRALHVLAHPAWVASASFSPDGKLVVTAGGDRRARVWDVSSEQMVAVLSGHTDFLLGAAFSPDGKLVATASQDRTARVWEIATQKAVHILRGHVDPVWSAAFSPDGRLLVTASGDLTARLWDLNSERALTELRGHKSFVLSAEFDRDGKAVVTASGDGTARLWAVAAERTVAALRGHSGRIKGVAFSPDGKLLVTASEDRTARIWDWHSARPVHVLRGHRDWVESAAFSADGTLVVTASEDATARTWRVDTAKPVAEFRGHADAVRAAAFSPDSKLIATASGDRTARIWKLETKRTVAELRGHSDRVDGIAFSPDGELVITASADGSARVWDLASTRTVAELGRPSLPLRAAAFSPNGQLVATVGDDATARVWDIESKRTVAELRGHSDRLEGVGFSPDGQFLVTASGDGSARVWEIETEKLVAELRGPPSSLQAAAFSPDGKFVAAVGAGGVAFVYACEVCRPIEELRQLARTRVSRPVLTPEEREKYLPGRA